MSAPFRSTIGHRTAKNRFSRRFVLIQKGASSRMLKNEYLLQQTVNCTIFLAFFSEMRCNMLLNAVRFGAKCKAKWCKMQCKMPLNVKRKA